MWGFDLRTLLLGEDRSIRGQEDLKLPPAILARRPRPAVVVRQPLEHRPQTPVLDTLAVPSGTSRIIFRAHDHLLHSKHCNRLQDNGVQETRLSRFSTFRHEPYLQSPRFDSGLHFTAVPSLPIAEALQKPPEPVCIFARSTPSAAPAQGRSSDLVHARQAGAIHRAPPATPLACPEPLHQPGPPPSPQELVLTH